ncbi:MAG: PQQ-binding-like beta-propeller repeat protein [Planctomycetes bacterium]|nr:PQQ-binding-like beta-propeller repeat protein [Planctomycetota bacterium]
MVSAPPAAAYGRVFLPTYDAVGTIDLSLQALDLYTGQPLWRTFLVSGQQETNLFGNILREMASQPPIYADGRVYFSTNLGAVACLDAETGQAIWTRRYTRSRVRTYQNGMESVRDETFANTLIAQDETRLLVAPADGETVFLLNKEDGRMLAHWPHRSNQFGELRTLAGVTDQGAWFHGTHMSFLPFPDERAPHQMSEPLFTRNGIPASRHGAALARGEILAPSLGAVEILDPRNLRPSARLKGIGTRGIEMGPLQVAPGLAFVLRPGGITAFSSPDAILKSLARSNWDSKTVERLLPYLESVDLSDPATASKVAERAHKLAENAPNAELSERLTMVAARGSLVAGQGNDALTLLISVLESRSDPRKVRAAELALDVIERTDPTHKAMNSVLAILEADSNRHVLRFDGSLEPKGLALARARVLQAGKRDFGSEAHLDALLSLLTQEGLETARQGDLNLVEWARLQVQSVLRDPQLANRIERRAQIAFDTEPPNDSLMQRFAGTDTAWKWLRNRARTIGNDRASALLLASWLRRYSWPQAQNNDFELIPTDLLVGSDPISKLPAGLEPLAQLELGTARLLDFDIFDGRLIVLAQSNVNSYLVELSADDQYQGKPFRLAETRASLPDLRGRSFVHTQGAALMLGDRWLNLPLRDGQREEHTLSGRVQNALRLGQLVALLCARGDGGIELEVRDLETATRLLSLPLPLRDDRFHTMAWKNDRLMVLQDGMAKALEVPIFTNGEIEEIPLINGPSTHQLERMIPLEDGLVLPYSRHGQKLLWLLRQGKQEALLQRPQHDLRTFRAPTGFGWLQSPLAPDPGRDEGPVLYWSGKSERSGRQLPFGDAETRFPQLESYSREREDFATDYLLTARAHGQSGTEISAWHLPASGDPISSWTLPLADIPFERLVGRLPAPIASDAGWLIPLKLLNSRTTAPRLILLLVTNEGKLRSRLELEAPGNSSLRIQPALGNGYAALRHESRLYLLGGE